MSKIKSALTREQEIPEETPMAPEDKYFVLACLALGLIALLLGSCTVQP